MQGFGCTLLGYDVRENPECLEVALDELWPSCDIISLHVPLMKASHHLLNRASLARIKPDALMINTSRGGLIDIEALIEAVERGHLGGVGLDVYEEAGKFPRPIPRVDGRRDAGAADDFPNVLVTDHQAFFTQEAVTTIAETTITNLDDFAAG